MSLVHVVADSYLLAKRETVQFFRRPVRLVSFFLQPLMFLFFFGFGIRAALRPDVGGIDYVVFIIPGLVGQRLITTAARGGMGLIRDRHGGFLKEVLVAPVDRAAVLMGLSMGHVIRSVLQGVLLLAIGVSVGLHFGGTAAAPLNFLMTIVVMTTMGLSIVMLSMAVAWKMDDQQNFGVVTTYLTFPLFLLSGALYPVSRLPAFLSIPVKLNPLTYAVDAMRYFAIGPHASNIPIVIDVMVITGFFLAALGFGMRILRTKQAD